MKSDSLKRLDLNQNGQSTIELILSMGLIFTFGFFFIQVALVLAYSNVVQYATFMAARSYMAAGPNLQDHDLRATATFEAMIMQRNQERFSFLGKGNGEGSPKGFTLGGDEEFEFGNRPRAWSEGARYEFKSRLFMIPLMVDPNRSEVTWVSESFLLRESTEDECIRHLRSKNDEGAVFFDNGC